MFNRASVGSKMETRIRDLFFLVTDHGIQAGLISGKMTSFSQLYLTNPLIVSSHTLGMADETSKGNVCVRESSNSRPP